MAQRILITGAHGFLGQHVTKRFKQSGQFQVSTPNRDCLDLLHTDIYQAFRYYRPDVVIHLAAQCGGIGINQDKPGEFLYNNLMMTTNLIEACRQFHIEKFVGIGTVCSYPKHTPVPFKEDDLYNGYPEETNAPYGLAKRMQLEQLNAYRKQYGLNGIFLIPVNMSGPYDNFNDNSSHVIPALIKKFYYAKKHGAESVTLWGDGSASREFLDVRDCAEAIYQATLHYDGALPVNIGTGDEIRIKTLAEKIRDRVGYNGNICWDTTKPNGQPRRQLDVSRARKEFNFVASISLEKTLRDTYDWWRENRKL